MCRLRREMAVRPIIISDRPLRRAKRTVPPTAPYSRSTTLLDSPGVGSPSPGREGMEPFAVPVRPLRPWRLQPSLGWVGAQRIRQVAHTNRATQLEAGRSGDGPEPRFGRGPEPLERSTSGSGLASAGEQHASSPRSACPRPTKPKYQRSAYRERGVSHDDRGHRRHW